MKKGSVLVTFGNTSPSKSTEDGMEIVDARSFLESGSIYEASDFTEKLSYLVLPDGVRVSKSFIYEGYELWWINYNGLFTYFGLPYTQYKKLLEYLKDYKTVYLYQTPYKNLFSYYLRAYGCEVTFLGESSVRIHLGILIQIIITILSLPVLILKRSPFLVFTGDKFEKGRDYDFRMGFVYREMRDRGLSFVEFVRSLESWKTVLKHASTRVRPVIYSEAVSSIGKLLSFFGGRPRFDKNFTDQERDPETQFKLRVATHYLRDVDADVWAIRMMRWIIVIIGVRAAFFTAALERNFHTVIGCKLNAIPTVGILHGLPTRHYNVYDFLPGFDGDKSIALDKYGVWSNWWKEYYEKYGQAYRPGQLYVSGPMRPLEKGSENLIKKVLRKPRTIRVLFISEQLAAPQEVVPYLNELLRNRDIDLTLKFRPTKDGFEEWLRENEPSILENKNLKIFRGSILDAVKECDVAVGSHSTAVLEALLELKIPIFYNTRKWGDCFSLSEYGDNHPFFAENPSELIEKIKNISKVSEDNIRELQERYFGDPYQNGSKWVVDQLKGFLATT